MSYKKLSNIFLKFYPIFILPACMAQAYPAAEADLAPAEFQDILYGHKFRILTPT
ncbi:hypothetical protein [Acidocella sp.]|uniref:hypothetical protein n=1 Tax=Acidocella sp. TaxID=50710 RepID=UPI002610EBB1|nr:hypothetical protein [Acidocella sp.]MDD2795078.1 hypothetical protein [Acidocella sp.]